MLSMATNPTVALPERKFTLATSHKNAATTESSTIRVPEPIAIAPMANTGISVPILRSWVSQNTGSNMPNRCMPI